MDIYCLGTGHATTIKNFNTCFVLNFGGGGNLLVDGGGGKQVLSQLEKLNIDVNNLEYGFLTHCHTDHLLGFVWVMRVVMYGYFKKERTKSFTVFASRQVLDVLETICKLTLGEKLWNAVVGKQVFLKEVSDGQCERICDVDIEFFDARCVEKDFPQMGFFIKKEGFVFAGDVPLCENLYQKFEQPKTLCLEAFCIEENRDKNILPLQKHKTVKESAIVAEKLGVKNLILWHSEDDLDGTRKQKYLDEAKKYFSGKVFAPDDLEILKGL